MSADQVAEKFRRFADGLLCRAAQDQVLSVIEHIPEAPSLDALTLLDGTTTVLRAAGS